MATIPSLALIPSGYKASKIYSVLPTDGSGDLTFTRAADTATRVNSDGLIESVLANIPRLDYLNSTCPRLLLEPQRTNSVLWSEQINNAGWALTNAPTITTNIATAPDGYGGADGIQDTTGGTFKRIRQNFSVSANSTNTASVFVKKETTQTNFGGLAFTCTGGTTKFAYGIINPIDGTIVVSSDSVIGATSTKVEDYGDWWRFSLTATDNGSNTSVEIAYYATISTNGTSTGLGTGSVRTVWGFQLEIGASYATSYIGPTLGATVTRGGDNCSTTSLQSASLIGATAGTFFLQTTKTDNAFWFNQRIFLTSTTVRSLLMDNSGGQIRLRTWDAASAGATITTSGLANGLVKYLIKWDGTNIKVFANGVLQGSSAQPSYAYTTYTAYESTSFSNNSISQLLFFPTALSDADCIALTA